MADIEREPNYLKVLDQVFKTNYDAVARKISVLGTIYDLPRFNFSLDTENAAYFDYTKTVQNFVVLVIYSDSKRVFLRIGADGEREQYSLPARSIASSQTVEDAVYQLGSESIPGARFSGLEPVAILDHQFILRGDGASESHEMKGVAYVVRILPQSARKFDAAERVEDGMLLRFDQARHAIAEGYISKYSNAEVLASALAHLDRFFQLRVRQPDEDIEANAKAIRRYRFHEAFVKPLLAWLKRSKKLNEKILSVVGEPRRFLDASCGDSKLVFQVAKRGAEVSVANDVAWDQVLALMKEASPSERTSILFTNHNLVFLPFRQGIFDVAICKNTLHHLNSPAEFELSLASLSRVARRILIIEVENPRSRWVSRVLNFYYRRFLLDAGRNFFADEQFRRAVAGSLEDKGDFRFEFSRFESIHANYLFALVEDRVDAEPAQGSLYRGGVAT